MEDLLLNKDLPEYLTIEAAQILDVAAQRNDRKAFALVRRREVELPSNTCRTLKDVHMQNRHGKYSTGFMVMQLLPIGVCCKKSLLEGQRTATRGHVRRLNHHMHISPSGLNFVKLI
jgi:hypothetical protein